MLSWRFDDIWGYSDKKLWGWSHAAAWGPGGLGTTTGTVPEDFGVDGMAVWEGKQHKGQVQEFSLWKQFISRHGDYFLVYFFFPLNTIFFNLSFDQKLGLFLGKELWSFSRTLSFPMRLFFIQTRVWGRK